MKKIFSLLLIVCMCVSIMVSCNNTGATNGSTATTTATKSTSASVTSTNANASGTTSATTSANVTAGTTTATTGITHTTPTGPFTDGTTASTTTSAPGTVTEKGERITLDQWNALVAGTPTNFTCTQTITQGDVNQTAMIYVNGDEYIQTVYVNGVPARILSCFIIDGQKDYYTCDLTTGKWTPVNHLVSSDYILYNCPYPFAEFDFDESTGTYSYVYVEDAEMDAKRNIEIRFKDGLCIYLKMSIFMGDVLAGTLTAETYDHGTTVITHPAPEDITLGNGGISGTLPE